MGTLTVKVISRSRDLPDLSSDWFFHSAELFRIVEESPGQKPLMAVALDAEGRVVANMLALVLRKWSFLPPYFFSVGRIYGEGNYAEGVDKAQLFPLLLKAVTRRFRRRFCLYAECSDLPTKMFGYAAFRSCGYFPVSWQEVKNSLHNASPEERITEPARRLVDRGIDHGMSTYVATTEAEARAFHHLLHRSFRTNFRRLIPNLRYFLKLNDSDNVRLFVTTQGGEIVGGAACVYSGQNAYLWYLGARGKRRRRKTINAVTVWHVLQHAYDHNYRHLCFLDAGMPVSHSPYREFILGFGGKPVTKFRWFWTPISWFSKMGETVIGG